MFSLIVVPARMGSKRLPNKNLLEIGGLSLVARAVSCAKQVSAVVPDTVVCVSSESMAVLDEGRKFGADILVARPESLSGDSVTLIPVLQHAITSAEASLKDKCCQVTLLQCTSPFRTAEDVLGSLEVLEATGCSSVLSVCESVSSPYAHILEKNPCGSYAKCKEGFEDIPRKQQVPQTFDINGAVFTWNAGVFSVDPRHLYDDTQIYTMPRLRSLDIDTEEDFKLAKCIVAAGLAD